MQWTITDLAIKNEMYICWNDHEVTAITFPELKVIPPFKDRTQCFCMLFLKLHFSYFIFWSRMDIDITGKLNDWTLFTYKNLFGLFSRKAEICWSWKINASYILRSKAKSCWGYTIIPISSNSEEIYLQNRVWVYNLIEHIPHYFKIYP